MAGSRLLGFLAWIDFPFSISPELGAVDKRYGCLASRSSIKVSIGLTSVTGDGFFGLSGVGVVEFFSSGSQMNSDASSDRRWVLGRCSQ